MTKNPRTRSFESNLKKTFEEICKHACEMIGVDHSGFVRFDPLNQYGEVVAEYPPKGGLIGRKIPLSGVPAEERLLSFDEPLVFEDVRQANDLGEVRRVLAEIDIRSACIVKVWFHGTVLGSFSVDSIGKHRQFTTEEIALCQSFAELASKTIENAQLVDWLENFEQATAAIISVSESASLLKTIVEQAEVLFSAQGVGLYQRFLTDEGQDCLKLVASSDSDLVGRILKKGEGMAWQLIASAEPYMTTPRYDTYRHRSIDYEGMFGSVLEVPLVRQTERLGVIYLNDIPGRQFSAFDATLLQRFADIAIIALQHCVLLNRIKELSIA